MAPPMDVDLTHIVPNKVVQPSLRFNPNLFSLHERDFELFGLLPFRTSPTPDARLPLRFSKDHRDHSPPTRLAPSIQPNLPGTYKAGAYWSTTSSEDQCEGRWNGHVERTKETRDLEPDRVEFKGEDAEGPGEEVRTSQSRVRRKDG